MPFLSECIHVSQYYYNVYFYIWFIFFFSIQFCIKIYNLLNSLMYLTQFSKKCHLTWSCNNPFYCFIPNLLPIISLKTIISPLEVQHHCTYTHPLSMYASLHWVYTPPPLNAFARPNRYIRHHHWMYTPPSLLYMPHSADLLVQLELQFFTIV